MDTGPANTPGWRSSGTHGGNSSGLTPQQVQSYRRDGFVGPLTLCSPAEMTGLRGWIEAEDFLTRPSPLYPPIDRGAQILGLAYERSVDWHLVYRRMHRLCTHPVLAAAMASVMGPDLLLWRSQFMLKEANGGEPIAWHKDRGFPGPLRMPALSPIKNISAWIAIDRADLKNGCMWCVPGTHQQEIPVRRVPIGKDEEGLFGRGFKTEHVIDTGSAVPMILEPGQFFLFTESTLHGSPHNPSRQRRMGVVIRVTTPDVRIYDGQTVDGQGCNLDNWGCLPMSGEDRYRYNKLIQPQFID